MAKRWTKQEFIDNALELHTDGNYDYSNINYKNTRTKIEICCKKHGNFKVSPRIHLNRKSGCPECKRLKILNEFIKKSNEKHNYKYDYSNINFVDMGTKIEIKCPEHGIFKQTPSAHQFGSGCYYCGIEKIKTSLTKEYDMNEYKKEASIIHKNKFDYSLVVFENIYKDRIKIICPKHGIYEQLAIYHLKGRGCKKCVNSWDKEKYVDEFNKIHDFKYIYDKTVIKNGRTKIIITCKEHGDFKQTTEHHMRGHGCPKCAGVYHRTTEDFIETSMIIHVGDDYDYSKTIFKNNKTPVIIGCKKHGYFEQLPKHHLNGSGCPTCRNSKGENKITNFLIKKNIKYKRNKTFEGCVYNKKLKFDFYLLDYNICIEFDGLQHFISLIFFGGDEGLRLNKIRDQIKTNFCIENDIKLIRIKYNENIEEKLKCLIEN